MSVPTQQQFRDSIDELMRLADAQPHLRTRGNAGKLILILGGLELELVDRARGALVLFDAGRGDTALPLIRKVYEFGVTAQWMHATRDTAAYFTVSERYSRAMDRDAITSGYDVPSAIIDEFRSAPPLVRTPESELLNRFEQVCKSFADGGLYLLYRYLSSACHPWFGATSRWLHPDDNPTGLRFSNPKPMEPEALLWPLAAGLIWCGRAVDTTSSTSRVSRRSRTLARCWASRRCCVGRRAGRRR